jgi:thioredoxin-dependent peroxiredoxin
MKRLLSLLGLLPSVALCGSQLSVGEKAPDFSLPASTGKTVKLSDYLGKQTVVLAFFPKAFTGG